MNAIAGIFADIIDTLLGLYATLVMLRFVFQLVRADFYNPISQAVVKMTSPLLVPLRRLIPGFRGLDTAALLLVLAIHILTVSLLLLLKGINPAGYLPAVLGHSVLKMIASLLNIFTFCMLGSIILSFVAPMSRHPAAMLMVQIAEPLMAPFRRFIPPMGGIDISPIFVFLALGTLTKILQIFAGSVGVSMTSLFGFVFL